MSGVTQCLPSCDWLISLTDVLKVRPCYSRCQNFLFKAGEYSLAWVDPALFSIHPLMGTWVMSGLVAGL